MVLGIFAGVGSGKSVLLDILKSKGFVVLEADKIAHSLYEKNEYLLKTLEYKFGRDILDEKGKLIRENLAKIIFNSAKARNFVDSLLHPLVWDYIKTKIKQAMENGENIAIEAAILPKEDKNIYDYKIFIDVDDVVRKARLKSSRNYSDEKIDNIMKSQLDKKAFASFCDFTIYNNTTIEDLEKEIDFILEKIENENV